MFIPHLLALRRRYFLLDAVEVIYRMEIYEIKARKVSHVEQSTLNIKLDKMRWRKRDRQILRCFEEERTVHFRDMLRRC